jgi:formylglycine-generating enzyme required for sulfatase activity
VSSILVFVAVANGCAQDKFTSYLQARRLPQAPATSLKIYGYPGSTNQIQYADTLTGTTRWKVLTNITLVNSTSSLVDSSVSQMTQRYYRAVVLGATPLNVSSNLVWIPPGQFLMGSPITEQERNSDEGPQTLVMLSRGFYIGKYLVTQGEYLALIGTNPSYFIGDTNRPVEASDWDGATNYCARLTLQEQSAGRLPNTWAYRLPTEAEWEYACRAGTTTRFSYGDDIGNAQLPQYAWYDGNAYTTNKPPGASYFVIGRYYTTYPVGQKLPNPWGLYDMHGNVAEWCQDFFGPYTGDAMLDPQGPSTGDERVIRSGSWLDDPYSLRCAFRYSALPGNVSGLYGFRVVLAPTGP